MRAGATHIVASIIEIESTRNAARKVVVRVQRKAAAAKKPIEVVVSKAAIEEAREADAT